MLQYILGMPASGKTTEIFGKIDSDKSEEILLLVPEQFSFETERELLSHANKNVTVTSFTRLLETVENIYGKPSGDRLLSHDKIIVMRNVLNKLAPSLNVYKKYVSSLSFCSSLLDLYDRLVMENTDLEEFSQASAKIPYERTKQKIAELSLIFNAYKTYTANNMLDPSDDLNRLFDIVDKNSYFKGKSVYIDAFKDFYGCQLKVLDCIIRDAENVYISFTCKIDGEDEVFHNIKTVIAQIDRICEKYSVQKAEPVILNESRCLSPEVSHIEKNLFSISPDVFAEHSNNFHTIETDSASDMFFDIFAEISRLVREEDYRYRDFVIIARDIKKYEKYLSSVSHKFSVPLFYDKRKPLKYAPLAKLAYNAYFASIKFNSDKIFNYLLSGFEIITEEEFDLLYNYVYMWSINGNDWLEKWYMNPDGFAEKTDDPDELQRIQKTIDKLNEIREKVIAPLQSLKNNTSEFARDKVKALYTFLDDIDASKMCAEFCEKKKQSDDFVSADFCRQSWDALIDVLNSLYKYIGNECVGDTEFCDLFYAAISSYAVGMIPQMLDEVSCGSADRIRPARPKCVFIIGLNLDEFPMTINENGILLNSERDMLIECGAKLVDNFTKLTVNENYLLYTCSCCASQKVYYCRSRFGGSNAALEPSPYFTKAEKMFPGCELNHDDLFGVATKESTFAVLSKNYKTKLGDTVQTALINDGVYAEKTERLGTQFEITDFTAHKEDVDKALGNTIYVSPTKVDTFYRCKFSYFCRYILKLESVRKAEIDNLSRGTLVHYILEKVIREYKRKIADLSREQLDAAAEKYAEEYLSNVIGSDFIMDGKIGFVIEEIKRMTKYVLYRISDEFYCSKFEPEYFEAKMSPEEDADFKSLVINADKKVVLRGNIDRADVWRDVNNKTYIRVVDYKTGKMKVNISDILYGLNLQMLLYLYGIVKNNTEDKSYIPAGVCYYLVDERTKTESDEQKDNEKVSTMYLFDDKLYNALDVTQSERFVKGMVTIKGKDGQKNNPFVAEDEMEVIFSHLDKKLKEMGNDIANGDFSVNPVEYSNKDSCKYCEFKSICMHEKELEKIDNYSLAQAMKKLTENADE